MILPLSSTGGRGAVRREAETLTSASRTPKGGARRAVGGQRNEARVHLGVAQVARVFLDGVSAWNPLVNALARVADLAREIREREAALDDAIRQAHRLGASQREIAASAEVSAATVNRRLARALTPEAAADLVERQAEAAATNLQLERLSLARRRLESGEEVDVEAEVGDVDVLIEQALRAADSLV